MGSFVCTTWGVVVVFGALVVVVVFGLEMCFVLVFVHPFVVFGFA